jgi:putative oxidoreductase
MSTREARSKSTAYDVAGLMTLYRQAVSPMIARWAPLPLRLIVGYGFAAHGFAKLLRGPDNFTGLLHAMGVPMPYLFAWITILTEIVGGIFVIIGAFIPLVSAPMAVVLLVTIFTVHLQFGFSSIKLLEITPSGAHFGQPGYETDLLYLACIVALVIGGSGPPSVDEWLLRRRMRSPRRTGSDNRHDEPRNAP